MLLFKICGFVAIALLFVLAVVIWRRSDIGSHKFRINQIYLNSLIDELPLYKENYDFIMAEFSDVVCYNEDQKEANMQLYFKFRLKYRPIVNFDYEDYESRVR